MKQISVGLAGYGMAAQFMHLPFLTTLPGYRLISILERKSERSREKYPSVKVVKTFSELVDDPLIELIVITTPNETHFEYAKLALEAGKHVVLEKPFTNTSAEAKELIAIGKRSGMVLSVYQNRRYVSDFLTIQEILDKELLGEILEFESHYDRFRAEAKPNAWREENKPGSGILYDLGSHLIDQALYLFGLPDSITADIRLQRPHARADDYFDLRIDFGSARIICKASMLVREAGPRYLVHGRKGSFIKYGEDPQEARLKAGELPTAKDWGMEDDNLWGLIHTEINNEVMKKRYPSLPGNFGHYYENLYDTIVHGVELKEKPEHGYNTIRMIELAMESNMQKKTIKCSGLISV